MEDVLSHRINKLPSEVIRELKKKVCKEDPGALTNEGENHLEKRANTVKILSRFKLDDFYRTQTGLKVRLMTFKDKLKSLENDGIPTLKEVESKITQFQNEIYELDNFNHSVANFDNTVARGKQKLSVLKTALELLCTSLSEDGAEQRANYNANHKKMNSDYAEFKKLETIIREREDELRRKYVELQEKQAALKETSEYIQGRLDKLSMEKDYQVNNQKIKELEEALETLKKAQNERRKDLDSNDTPSETVHDRRLFFSSR